VVKRVLGMSVSATTVRAVLVDDGTIAWAGVAPHGGGDLAAVIGHLAGESGRVVRRSRVVLERDVVQLRTVSPAPPLKPRALQRYVSLEAPRLFRKNGAPIVTDGIRLAGEAQGGVLWAAAAEEPMLDRILAGSAEAGLIVESVGPAADVLPAALAHQPANGEIAFPNGGTTEVLTVGAEGTWRSRMVRGTTSEASSDFWAPPLVALGPDAAQFAAAYAATVALPRLELWPGELKVARARESRRALIRLAAVALALWVLAGMVYIGRLFSTLRSSTEYLDAVAVQLDSALAARRDLDAGRVTFATMTTAERTRSRHLEQLAGVTAALGDSAYLMTYQMGADGTLRLSGYAPSAARALAALEHVSGLRSPRLEGPLSREAASGGRSLDRFAIVAQRVRGP
jgi:hypothetical protein